MVVNRLRVLHAIQDYRSGLLDYAAGENSATMGCHMEQWFHSNLHAVTRKLALFCQARGIVAWLVGGTVRDMAMGRASADLDVATPADGLALAREFADLAGGAFVALDSERSTGRVVLESDIAQHEKPLLPDGRVVLDIARLRAPTLAEDLALRDFTINALALPLSAQPLAPGAIIDPCGGLRHLAAGELRLCQPASLRDDPLRLLRAVRLAAELGFHITTELDDAIRQEAALIEGVAAERVRDELLKTLNVAQCAPWLHYLDTVGILTRLIPELEPARACDQPVIHFLPVLAHMLETVAALEWLLGADDAPPVAVQTHPDLPRTFAYAEHMQEHMARPHGGGYQRAVLLKLAALLHDNAKPQTRQPKPDGGVSFHEHQTIGAEVAYAIGRRLRLSRQDATYLSLVVRNHMRPFQLQTDEHTTPRAIARFFRDTSGAGPDVLLHELADHLATRGPNTDPDTWRAHLAWSNAMLDACWGTPPEQRAPLVNGNDIMALLGIAPGPLVGTLLREIDESRATGEIATRKEALALAQRLFAAHTGPR